MKVATEEPIPAEEAAEGAEKGAEGAEGAEETLTRTVMAGVEEPAHSVVAEEARQVPLRVFAVADNARYECDVAGGVLITSTRPPLHLHLLLPFSSF